MTSTLLNMYLAKYNKALKQFNNLVLAKPTQIRSIRNKKVFEYFHTKLLPKLESIDSKLFNSKVKELSKIYRNPKIDVDGALDDLDNLQVRQTTKPIPKPKQVKPVQNDDSDSDSDHEENDDDTVPNYTKEKKLKILQQALKLLKNK